MHGTRGGKLHFLLDAFPLGHGVTDLDATVRALDAKVDGILEKRRWMLDRAKA